MAMKTVPFQVTALYAPVEIVRCVHVMPSGDVAQALLSPTATKTEPFQVIARHWNVPGRLRAVQVVPSDDVAPPPTPAEDAPTAQKIEPFQTTPYQVSVPGRFLAVQVIPSLDVAPPPTPAEDADTAQ